MGDQLRLACGAGVATVTALRPYDARLAVYNLTVEHSHTYAVGAECCVVHNTGCLPRHHLYPQSEEFAAYFKRAGIKIHDHTIELLPEVHRNIHGGADRGGAWNMAWRQFFAKNPMASKAEIEEHAKRMVEVFGLPSGPVVKYR